jgi:hypothetical protein
MTENANGQSPSNVKTSAAKRHVSPVKGLVIVVVVVITLVSAIAIGAVVITPLLNQMSSDTDTDTTGGIDADDIVTNPDKVENNSCHEGL